MKQYSNKLIKFIIWAKPSGTVNGDNKKPGPHICERGLKWTNKKTETVLLFFRVAEILKVSLSALVVVEIEHMLIVWLEYLKEKKPWNRHDVTEKQMNQFDLTI